MWQAIQKWFKAKGGVAHVLAGTWVFLVSAYAINPQFHASILKLKGTMPGWVEDLITLAVSLFTFYKTWTSAEQKPDAPEAPPAQ